MATSTEAKQKFAAKLSQLVQHHDLDSSALTSLSSLMTTLAAVGSGTTRHRGLAEAIETWSAAQ